MDSINDNLGNMYKGYLQTTYYISQIRADFLNVRPNATSDSSRFCCSSRENKKACSAV